jgi:hypothetical protein
MRKQITAIAIALLLVATGPISAFCASANRVAPGPQSGVHLSLAHPPVLVLAQAKTDSGDGTAGSQSYMNKLISDGLLTSSGDADVAQPNSDSMSSQSKHSRSGNSDNDGDAGDPQRCKNGKSTGNKHCIPSPSE